MGTSPYKFQLEKQDPDQEIPKLITNLKEYRARRPNPINIKVVGNLGVGKSRFCQNVRVTLWDAIPSDSIQDSEGQSNDEIIELINTASTGAVVWIINATDDAAMAQFLLEYNRILPQIKARVWIFASHTDQATRSQMETLKQIFGTIWDNRTYFSPLIDINEPYDPLADFNILIIVKSIYDYIIATS
jgi:hypothetical protein